MAARVHAQRKGFANQTLRPAVTDQAGCGRVGFQDALRRRIDHQHGFGGHLEQVPIARLGVAKFPVVALHGLLRVDQALLQGGGGTQVAATEQSPALAQRHGGQQQRQFPAAGQDRIDLAPARRRCRCRRGRGWLEQAQGLAPAFDRDQIHQRLAHPGGQFLVG